MFSVKWFFHLKSMNAHWDFCSLETLWKIWHWRLPPSMSLKCRWMGKTNYFSNMLHFAYYKNKEWLCIYGHIWTYGMALSFIYYYLQGNSSIKWLWPNQRNKISFLRTPSMFISGYLQIKVLVHFDMYEETAALLAMYHTKASSWG